jgi:two-component system, chemotaxis family, sensor kinase Cph1
MTFAARVLVVDDEFLVALATADALESVGCEVVGPVSQLATAFQLAHSELLDAAVLDINIAGATIWPVASELLDRGVPFLFLSALIPLIEFPARFANAPRLDKPLIEHRLLNHLGALWGASGHETGGAASD